MHLLSASTAVALLAVAPNLTQAANAPLTFDNTGTIIYEASLLNKSTTPIRGVLTGRAGPNGMGIRFDLRFWGLPSDEYIKYRIHEGPLPRDGNCSNVGPLFDPYQASAVDNCDFRNPATWAACAVGDLAGKHGPLPHTRYMAEYLDDFLSVNTADPAFFGNKVLVAFKKEGSGKTLKEVPVNCGAFERLEGSGDPVTVPFTWPSSIHLTTTTKWVAVASADSSAQPASTSSVDAKATATGSVKAPSTRSTSSLATMKHTPPATRCRVGQVLMTGTPGSHNASQAICVTAHSHLDNGASMGVHKKTTAAKRCNMAIAKSVVSPSATTTARTHYPSYKHNSDSANASANANANGAAAKGVWSKGLGMVGVGVTAALFVLFC